MATIRQRSTFADGLLLRLLCLYASGASVGPLILRARLWSQEVAAVPRSPAPTPRRQARLRGVRRWLTSAFAIWSSGVAAASSLAETRRG